MLQELRPTAAILKCILSDKVGITVFTDIRRTAREVWETLISLGSVVAALDLWLYYFSNGGAYVHDGILPLLEDHVQKKNSNIKLKGILFDSAPTYWTSTSFTRGMNNGKDNCLFHIFSMILVQLTSGTGVKDAMWNDLVAADLKVPELYIYSLDDSVTPSNKLREFAESRKEAGVNVTVVEFEGSDHVMHFRNYPKEYSNAIEEFLLSSNSS